MFPGIKESLLFIAYAVCVILALGCIIACLVIKINRAKERLPKYFDNYHAIAHNCRDTISQHLPKDYRKAIPDIVKVLKYDDLDLIQKLCDNITSGVLDTMREYIASRGIQIGEDISIAVKLVGEPTDIVLERYKGRYKRDPGPVSSPSAKLVITVYRDSNTILHSHGNREIGTLSRIDANTECYNAMEGKPYCHNDLQLEERNSRYKNADPHWKKWYNAKLTVPIRSKELGCIGVLDVDSPNKNKHDLYDAKCIDIAAHGADLLSVVFLSLARCKYIEHYYAGVSAAPLLYNLERRRHDKLPSAV